MQNSSGQKSPSDAVDLTVMIPAVDTGVWNAAPVNGSQNCLEIGTRIAEFEILGIIGEGGFGIVYLAFDHSLQRTVALKEYMPGVMAGRNTDQSLLVRSSRHQEAFNTGLKSFINEARLLAQFDHPALIKIHRFWEQNNTGYMAMRFYEGKTLKRILQDQPQLITEKWLKSLLLSITDALDALYKVQILHRDISPENIMILKTGKAVLLDFGAARQIISNMAQSLTVILKPGYAPIEQYADDPSMEQGQWTDIYSLSAVLYLAITKKTPPSSVARMMKDPITALKGHHPGFSPEFLDAIDLGFAVRPEKRPQSIADFRTLLGIGTTTDIAKKRARQSSNATLVVPEEKKGTQQVGTTQSLQRDIPAAKILKANLPSPRNLSIKIAACTAVILIVVIAVNYGISDEKVEESSGKRPVALTSLKLPEIKPIISPSQKMEAPETAVKNAELGQKERRTTESDGNPVSASVAVPVAPVAFGIVSLSVKPWGKIIVDGTEKGVSPPLKRLSLTEGKHTIKIVNPSFAEKALNVDIKAKKTRIIDVDFSHPSENSP
jgi:serine/threonine protein kinase